ncbi:phage tail sheath C-terminal domain-containing protein [Longispora sp. K20-0274]|uniref:phage tail sheath family protein n=1 Tax=Longispora sp. K20-0274 TaxID=3088255 RepID=UPI00399BBBDD
MTGLRLGAPGIYRSPRRGEPAFQPVRLDIAGFVGVALRGPVHTPTTVTSWSDYQRLFGGYERPGGGPDRMLPYAVRAFFAQGGVRAVVVRVAPPDGVDGPGGSPLATARYRLGALELDAANEGSWGDHLTIRLSYDVAASFHATVAAHGDEVALPVPGGVTVVPGELLRLRGQGPHPAGVYRWVRRVDRDATGRPLAVIGTTPGEPPVAAVPGAALDVEVVTATLEVTDADPEFARHERLPGLGLAPGHPRYLPDVLPHESALVTTAARTATLEPSGPLLPAWTGIRVRDGSDRWRAIGRDSFFDDGPADADPLDERGDHRGVDRLGRDEQVGLLCVPDLLWSWPDVAPPPADPPAPVGGCPSPCPPPPSGRVRYAPAAAPPALLDPGDPDQLREIAERQARLVTVADLRRRFVALLDVPPGLPYGEIGRWRARFDSGYAAAYHPWLRVGRAGVPAGAGLAVPPSVFAAGIIAARERRLGLPWGPAGELASGAVAGTDRITDTVHDQLHLLGVNVFREERDGFRLTAARTLSGDPDYRQLSVRRLMTMLALTLERQAQWLVFEPNTADLRAQLTHTVTQFLRELARGGAFAGRTEAESFFVHCDDRLNPGPSRDQGRLIAEVGVAPASPLEYLVLRISQDTDGRVRVEAGP